MHELLAKLIFSGLVVGLFSIPFWGGSSGFEVLAELAGWLGMATAFVCIILIIWS